MPSACNDMNAQLWARFLQKDAVAFETAILQPSARLLDLYGEDIRARAYTTFDAERGEMVLRPDFTVPCALDYLGDAKKAGAMGQKEYRYCYRGVVFRATDGNKARRIEEEQTGFEIIGAHSPQKAEIEVFSIFYDLFEKQNIRFVFSDIQLLLSAISTLKISAWRKAFLRRHIWRPSRFMELLELFSSPAAGVEGSALGAGLPSKTPAIYPEIGLRSVSEVKARLRLLHEDAKTPPLAGEEKARIKRLLRLKISGARAVDELRALGLQTEEFAARLKAFEARGIDLERLSFDASYGQSSMEYYDGFIFGGHLCGYPDAPPLITGGRYDALMRALGGAKGLAAVGGVFRNKLFMRLGGAGGGNGG